MVLGTVDIGVAVLYAMTIFFLAQWVSRETAGHTKNASDYFLAGRNFVIPDDVQQIAPFVLSHRIELERGFGRNVESSQSVIRDIVEQVTVPV